MKIVQKNEFWLNEQHKSFKDKEITLEYAFVVQLTLQGAPIIQFIGADLPSPKTYRRVKSYAPAIGDVVMILDETIIGGWKV